MVALVVANSGGDTTPQADKHPKPVGPAGAQLQTATAAFARQPVIRYNRQITTSADESITVDLSVTQRGTTTGTFLEKGIRIAVLVVDDKTFFRAPTTYWLAHDTEVKRAARYSKQWVRVSPQRFGVDPQALLAPGVLAARFPKDAGSAKHPAPIVAVRGVRTRQIVGADETVYVATAAPYRVMRVQSTRDKFDLDTTFFAEPFVTVLFKRIDTQISQLGAAIDSQVIHSVDGKVQLAPCGQTSCTAKATINTVTTPYTNTGKPTAADVSTVFTLDRHPIGTCTKVLTLPAAGKAPTACKVGYRLPADGKTHSIEAVVLAIARAVLTPDIATLHRELAGETVDWRLREAGATGLPGSDTQHGPFRFVPPAGYRPYAGPIAQTGSGYVDAEGNVWTEVAPRGAAARHGFAQEWKVKLSAAGQAKWRSPAHKNNGDYYLSVTPDGKRSH